MLLPFCAKIIFFVIAGLLFTPYFCIKNKPDNKLYYPLISKVGSILACQA